MTLWATARLYWRLKGDWTAVKEATMAEDPQVHEGARALWQSKRFWLNLLTTLVGTADYVTGSHLVPAAYLPAVGAVVGVANIVLQTWFNGDRP